MGETMQSKVIRLAGALCCIAPTQLWALDGGTGAGGAIAVQEAFGSCSFFLSSFQAAEAGSITLLDATNASLGNAGASVHSAGNVVSAPEITASDLESCGFSDVTSLEQNGAEPAAPGGLVSNYAFDSEMFIRFRATDDSDGNTYDYEFALRG